MPDADSLTLTLVEHLERAGFVVMQRTLDWWGPLGRDFEKRSG